MSTAAIHVPPSASAAGAASRPSRVSGLVPTGNSHGVEVLAHVVVELIGERDGAEHRAESHPLRAAPRATAP